MRAIVFTLMSILCAAAYSATVYKWVDDNGVTHYSDQPHENAEKVQVAQPQTYKAPRNPVTPTAGPASKSASHTYNSCQVTQPANEDTFPNATSVNATVTTNPGLQSGDQVYVMLDGTRVPSFPVTGGSSTISPIERGSHSLQAVVQDSGGSLRF
jgi:hypothetical protein